MIKGKDDDRCTGCGACASACPKQCISIKEDSEGFFYPDINAIQCVECNICSKVCHLNMKNIENESDQHYACYSNNSLTRESGSSGGLFKTIADFILEKGGIVYGAALSDDCRTLSHESTRNTALNKLLKSKYLESNIYKTFLRIQNDLEQNIDVLFCGTPCQVRGLVRYLDTLHISRQRLVCVDFLCHGVPSGKAYRSYIDYIETKYQSKVKEVQFRSKKLGWGTYCMYIEFVNGKQYIKTGVRDPYYRFFFECNNFRKSCYGCSLVEHSVADITLGDYWGQHFDCSDKGVSYVATHNQCGEKVLESIKKEIVCIPVSSSDVQKLYSGHDYKREAKLNYDFSKYKSSLVIFLKDLILKTRVGRILVYLKRR